MPDWTNLVFALRKQKTHLADSAADAIEYMEARNDAMKKAYLELCNNYSHGKDTWISCEEQLPEHGRRVLAFINGEDGKSVWDGCRWNGKEWEVELEPKYEYWVPIGYPVTHWMPLPKEPEK